MNDSKIAVRYAKALFQVAEEKKNLDAIRIDIEFVAQTSLQSEFGLLLESPVVTTIRKKAIFTSLFEKKINEITLRFLLMIIDNKRENQIPAICNRFIAQHRKQKGIKAAKLTTATPLDKVLKDKISKIITELFETEVELATEEDKEIIGGFILRVDDQQIDSSVSTKLNKIRRDFLNASV